MSESITDEAALRELIGEPADLVRAKVTDRVNDLTRRFIDLSPFMLLATSAPDGTCDVSPRGDPAGFVKVIDERTLLIPDRPGNRLADSLRNILRNPHVGLLFLVPGVGDTLRVNGRATIVTDVELLGPLAVEEKAPKLGLLVEVDEVFTHCSKAFLRSQLWDADRHVDRSELPSSGEVHRSLNPAFDAETYDDERAERYARREGFY
jgi:PPOX class probable FMN-dependent enzyme